MLNNNNFIIDYFIPGPDREADKRKSAKITNLIHKEFSDIFSGIGYFEDTFLLQVKEGSKP